MRRLLLACIEASNPRQVIGEIRPERRIDVHLGREVRVDLLLHECRMEVTGVDDDQTDIGHGDLRSSKAVRKGDWREAVAGQLGGVFRFTEKRYSARFVLIVTAAPRALQTLPLDCSIGHFTSPG